MCKNNVEPQTSLDYSLTMLIFFLKKGRKNYHIPLELLKFDQEK